MLFHLHYALFTTSNVCIRMICVCLIVLVSFCFGLGVYSLLPPSPSLPLSPSSPPSQEDLDQYEKCDSAATDGKIVSGGDCIVVLSKVTNFSQSIQQLSSGLGEDATIEYKAGEKFYFLSQCSHTLTHTLTHSQTLTHSHSLALLLAYCTS